jgi:hypothetical protein
VPIVDNPALRTNVATVPADTNKPPRYGQVTQTVKDAFVVELKKYFSTSDVKRNNELHISKYAVAANVDDDPFATAVELVRAYPNIMENLPMAAVLSTAGKNLKLSISGRYVDNIQYPPSISATTVGPYAFVDGDTLQFTSTPDGVTESVSTCVFDTAFMPSIGASTPQHVVNMLRPQLVYLTPTIDSDGKFAIAAGGPLAPPAPNKVEITGGSANALTVLGWTVSDIKSSTDSDQRMMHRYYVAASLTVSIEIAAESEHQRTEITDLVFDFFTFAMADRQFTFLGRSTFDNSISDETYQIIIQDAEVSISGEQELPRIGDQADKIFVNRVNVPVQIIQYVDRIMTDAAGNQLVPYIQPDVVQDTDLTLGN